MQYVNPTFEKFFGYSGDELVGKNFQDISKSDKMKNDVIQAINDHLQNGKVSKNSTDWSCSAIRTSTSVRNPQIFCCLLNFSVIYNNNDWVNVYLKILYLRRNFCSILDSVSNYLQPFFVAVALSAVARE